MTDRRQHIINTVSDMVGSLLYYDRKEDEDLPRGEIEAAIKTGEVQIEEILEIIEKELRQATQH